MLTYIHYTLTMIFFAFIKFKHYVSDVILGVVVIFDLEINHGRGLARISLIIVLFNF
jgi:hypothetical protein